MCSIKVVGVGLNTEVTPSFRTLAMTKIVDLPKKAIVDEIAVKPKFNSLSKIAREDKALLNENATLAIDSACEAFQIAELSESYTAEERRAFPIYIGNETAEHSFASVENFIHNQNGRVVWDRLGDVKSFLNPLDMLRLLSTNALYHVSKVLQLQGGGYPVRRMSLSGLCALEEAFLHLGNNADRALVVASGNLKTQENLCTFHKMGLVQSVGNQNGIIPAFGSAALVLEREIPYKKSSKVAYAELLAIETLYKPENLIQSEDWLTLFNKLPYFSDQNLTVISYDNGIQSLAVEERKAINQRYPNAQVLNYKKIYGYTGKANNLIDMVTALADDRVPSQGDVLINGIGMNMGLGAIYFKKLADIRSSL